VTEIVNLFDTPVTDEAGVPDGYLGGSVTVGPLIGAQQLGLSVYELPPGQSACPYHYELAREEWLIVLVGHPTLRTPAGEEKLGPWDCAFFPVGEQGAHKVTNRTADPVRVAILSSKGSPSVVVYPDSAKVGVSPPGELFRLADAVDYWDGELPEGASPP
jgi:uncharacterized cupin superfamily protein